MPPKPPTTTSIIARYNRIRKRIEVVTVEPGNSQSLVDVRIYIIDMYPISEGSSSSEGTSLALPTSDTVLSNMLSIFTTS